MPRKSSAVLEKPTGRNTCQHHWLIEPANGITSNGICKYCGARKQFLNIIQDVVPDQKGLKNKSEVLSAEEQIEEPDDADSDDDEDDEN
jgi:hypothetical protein